MKKKLLAILMATAMTMSLVACGGSADESAANNDVVTEEQSNDVAEEQVEEVTEETTEEGLTVDTLASVFTVGFEGMDTDENVYYFVCDEEMLSAGLVALTADLEQNLMCIGDVTHNEDGSMTIVDPSGITATMAVVESTEDYLQVVIDGALEVTLVPQDAAVVLEKMSIVEEGSQNIN